MTTHKPDSTDKAAIAPDTRWIFGINPKTTNSKPHIKRRHSGVYGWLWQCYCGWFLGTGATAVSAYADWRKKRDMYIQEVLQ